MPNILTLVDYFLPGYKAGGPIRSLANMVDQLGDEFHFRIITSNRDCGDKKPYSGIMPNSWQPVGKANVFYLSPARLSLLSLYRLIRATEHDVIYLNSFFSPHFTIKPLLLRRLGMIQRTPIILAPRGEFSPGALSLKSFKKKVYIFLSKLVGLYTGIIWQASSEQEEVDIRRWFGYQIRVIIAPNLSPCVGQPNGEYPRHDKTAGCLKIVFLSRVSRKKNLDGALKMLNGLKGKLQLDIYGPISDRDYWLECHKIIKQLPKNIEVKYHGAVEHKQVASLMSQHDLFFLPTLGENFGHVILEALTAGCPVLITDQTPWRNLEKKGIGWDLPLNKPDLFQDVLRKCLQMDSKEHAQLSHRAREYGLKIVRNQEIVEQNRQLFYRAIRSQSNCAEK